MRGAEPVPGFDVNYIEATGIDLSVDSFYNHGVEITVPLRRFAARERSGLSIQGSGTFAMDSARMEARDFNISTVFSHLAFNGMMGMGDLARGPRCLSGSMPTGQLAWPTWRCSCPPSRPC